MSPFSVFIRFVTRLIRGEIHVVLLTQKSFALLRQRGISEFFKRVKKYLKRNFISPSLNLGSIPPVIPQKLIIDWAAKNKHKTTILIPSYNDFDLIKDCLKSLISTVPPEELNVLIVDDSANPKQAEKLRSLESENIKIVVRPENGGFAKCVNSGMNQIPDGDIILLNSDTVAHKGWFESLCFGAYVYEEGVGIVGPKLLYPDGRIQSAGTFRNKEQPQWFDHMYRFCPADHPPANLPTQVLAMTGACLYIKRQVIDTIGHLDEGCVFAFDDVDYCLRAWKAGFSTLYFPLSTLTHREGATRPKSELQKQREMASISYFWKKWGDWFDNRIVHDPATGKIRLIYILQSTGISGGIRTIFEQMSYLSKSNFQCELWCLDDGPDWIKNDIAVRSFANYEDLIDALRHEDAIKIATWWETAYPVWKASFHRGIPVYYIQEVETWFYPTDTRAQQAVLGSYRREFHNITISQFNLEELNSLGIDATMISSGYDSTKFKPIEGATRESDVLLSAGRTFFQKNFAYTMRAWQALGPNRPQLWLYGQEPDLAKLDPKIKYFNRPSDDQLNELYNRCTAFILTSRHEGFALPPLEAMASGTPVICTDAHGNRNYIRPGENCLLVSHDSDKQLSETIEKLFASPDLQRRLGADGINTAHKFAWVAISKQLGNFFSTAAAQKNREVIAGILNQEDFQANLQ